MMIFSSTASLAAAVAAAALLADSAHAFVVPPSIATRTAVVVPQSAVDAVAPSLIRRPTSAQNLATALFMSTPATGSTLALSLEKPLGLFLEEADDGAGGVVVTEVNEGGSAYESPDKERLIQSKISTVMGQDVITLSFDEVMDAIVNAPSPLEIEFAVASAGEAGAETVEAEPAAPTFAVGAAVTITVQQPETNKPDITLEAKVGDNLRKTLLANKDVELYRGMKKKLGNCGGGGQCGWCAVELIDEEGVWGERSDYEAQRIGKNGNEKCRLACMNNIVGPATVRTL